MVEETRQQRRLRERLQKKQAKPPSWLHRNISKNASTIREVGFGGLAFACALAAWFSGGDMTLAVPVLILCFVFAAIGIGTASYFSGLQKLALCGLVLVLLIIEGAFLKFHQPVAPPPSLQASNFRAQIIYSNFRIVFTLQNSGSLVARSIEIEMNAGIGPMTVSNHKFSIPPSSADIEYIRTHPTNTPTKKLLLWPDDFAPNDHRDLVLDSELDEAQLTAIQDKPFLGIAYGKITFKSAADEITLPFDYWVEGTNGADLSRTTPMERRPPIMTPYSGN